MAKLYFYYSAMNAGKSTLLLQSNYNYQERGMHTLLLTPAIDTRYGVGNITSRIGLSAKATTLNLDDDIYTLVATHQENRRVNCILVDEAHFLSKEQVFALSNVVDKLDIPVLCYGLRSDFKAEPFPGSMYLLVLADKIIEVKTVCHCGAKASMNMRIDAKGNKLIDGAQVQIGGNESYVATCRKHFFAGCSGVSQLYTEDSLAASSA